jgi:hypothetical protein
MDARLHGMRRKALAFVQKHPNMVKIGAGVTAATATLSQTGAAAYSANWTDAVSAGSSLASAGIATMETEPFGGIILAFVTLGILGYLFRTIKR